MRTPKQKEAHAVNWQLYLLRCILNKIQMQHSIWSGVGNCFTDDERMRLITIIQRAEERLKVNKDGEQYKRVVGRI